ncbi:MAG: ribosome-recycling factor, partial [Oscillospiraceae bacterium]
LSKQIAKMGEDGKVAIRNIRRDANDKLKVMKKSAEFSEDAIKDLEKKIQDITDKFCNDIDIIAADKENEIMEI